MARSTNEAAQLRREKVAALHVRGQGLTAIATVLKCSWRTVKADVGLLAREWAADDDLDAERRRLLRGAREVESEAWRLYARLTDHGPGANKIGALGKVLQAQAAQLAIVEAIAGLDVERRLAELEARLDQAGAPASSRSWLGAGRN